jgi:SAM domain (Sterile alpha motif)
MSEVRNWLEGIGLAQYADDFEANDIEMDLLNQIDDQLLKDIGISSAGHRLRIRNAIAKLAPTPVIEASSPVVAPESVTMSAERRLFLRNQRSNSQPPWTARCVVRYRKRGLRYVTLPQRFFPSRLT